MSILPAIFTLKLIQGSTYDETVDAPNPDGSDPGFDVGHTAVLTIRKDYDSPVILQITHGTPSSAASKVQLLATGYRIYFTDDDLAETLHPHTQFTESTDEDGKKQYTGVWDLELTAAGVTWREAGGDVTLSREVSYG